LGARRSAAAFDRIGAARSDKTCAGDIGILTDLLLRFHPTAQTAQSGGTTAAERVTVILSDGW
jgi:hypothetical protein